MIRKIGGAILFLTLCWVTTVDAQSGRNKQPGEVAAPPRSRPNVELPEARVSVAQPTPTPTPSKTIEPEDDDIIKVDSTLVPIPVSVTDVNGNAIANLRLEDFELRVNGQLQEISEVFRSESPVRLALLFDNSSSVSVARDFQIKTAVKFLRRVLRPGKDQVSLFAISTVPQQVQRLTGDIRQVSQAIENFPEPAGATALFDAVVQSANYLREFAHDGRRVIVIVSDGVDTISDRSFEQTVREAQVNNCQIYVVKTTDFDNYQRTGQRGGNANVRDLAAERRMQDLAAQTGGAVYSPLDEKELEAAFGRIAGELAEQYILSYYPNDDKRDGSFKQISLQVKSNKDLTVRTRKGYYVSKL